MSDPLLDAATITTLQAVRLSGLVQPGLTVGGASWQVEASTGDGVSADVTIALGTAYAGYTEPRAAVRERAAGTGQLYDTPWLHVVTAATPPTLASGDVIRGSGYRFRIVGAEPDALYPSYACDQVQG